MRKTNRQRRTFNSSLEIREEQEEMIIQGYFAVFNTETKLYGNVYESIDEKAFDYSIGGDVRALIDHDTAKVLGRTKAGTLELKTDKKGLFGTIKINPKDTEAVNLYERVKRGDVNQCSFGFVITDESAEYGEDGTTHFVIKDLVLFEVSICTFPAYEDTAVEARRKQVEEHNIERWKKITKERLKCH